jgi:transcriptional regulator with XRE-family HTH domain
MQRNTFGQIVASLRKERRDPRTGRPWTQQQLATASRLSLRIIANLEQGKKATLDGAMLESLAAALQLTTLERREFFTLAIDLEDGSAAAPVYDVTAADAELLELFAGLYQPAFLYDDYFDILAANPAALTLHAIEPGWLQSLAGEGERPNFLHVIFAPDSPMRRSMQAGWRMLALRNLHQFRAMALRHRHTTRWHDLMVQLRMLPDFSAYWEETHFGQADICQFAHVTAPPICSNGAPLLLRNALLEKWRLCSNTAPPICSNSAPLSAVRFVAATSKTRLHWVMVC